MERNLIEDLSKLTTIPQKALDKLVEKSMWIICDDVQESCLESNVLTTIDLGIGKLLIDTSNDAIRYKFIPNCDLDNALKKVIIDDINPLKNTLELALVNKILNTYKTIL